MTENKAASSTPSSPGWIWLWSALAVGPIILTRIQLDDKIRSVLSIVYALITVLVVGLYFAFRRRYFAAHPDSPELRCPWELPAPPSKRKAVSRGIAALLMVAAALGLLLALYRK